MDMWERLKEELQSISADWDISECDITRPPKEVAPKDDGMRQFEPGGHMRIIIHLKKKEAGTDK